MDETKELLLAIKNAVELTNAKVTAIDERLVKLEGRVVANHSEIKREVRDVRRAIVGLSRDVDSTMDRLDELEQDKH